jgi:hypothetical protein
MLNPPLRRLTHQSMFSSPTESPCAQRAVPTAKGLVEVVSPWQDPAMLTDLQTNQVMATSAEGLLKVSLSPGHRYLMAPLGFVLADLPITTLAIEKEALTGNAKQP